MSALMLNAAAFERAIAEALGLDLDKDRVVAIDISLRPLKLVKVTITRTLRQDEWQQVTDILRGVKWEKEARP